MNSPFPGMDPYLEANWRDVHAAMVYAARSAIQRQLGGDLRARIDERLVIERDFESIRSVNPDVRVFEKGQKTSAVSMSSPVALAEPLVLPIKDEEVRETFVQIIDVSSGGRVVTVIEFVSPTNKRAGDGREKYRRKQQEVLDAGINLVEIDLTRSGERQLLYPVAQLPPAYQTQYLACVLRGFGSSRFEIYRMPLRERLPGIRIPLRAEDSDAALDIQSLVDTAYSEGRYDDIDYTRPCVPPLDPEDARWARELVTSP